MPAGSFRKSSVSQSFKEERRESLWRMNIHESINQERVYTHTHSNVESTRRAAGAQCAQGRRMSLIRRAHIQSGVYRFERIRR